jgi:thioesterase domain-containing protein
MNTVTIDTPDMGKLLNEAMFYEAVGKLKHHLTPLNMSGTLQPIIAVASVVGRPTDYSKLVRELGSCQPFYALGIPHAKRVAAYGDVVAIAKDHAQAIADSGIKSPILLGGWSAGAIIALAMLPELKKHAIAVEALIIVDHAPYNGPLRGFMLAHERMKRFVYALDRAARKASSTVELAKQIVMFPFDAENPIRKWHLMDVLAEKEHLEPATRDFVCRVYETGNHYVPEHRVDVPVLLLVADRHKRRWTPIDTMKRLADPFSSRRTIAQRWRRIADDLTIVSYNGTHGTLMDDPQVIAGHIREALPTVLSRGTMSA